MGGNRVGAGIALVAGALTVTVALALTRTEADGLQITTPEGKGVPSTTLDLSVLGSDGNTVDLKANTDSSGKLRIDYVPWDQWRAETASQGTRLSLPDNAFATVREPDALGMSARTAFGIRDGHLLDPAKYALSLASPFSLLCRSDEGLPRTLATGDRFAYEVTGDRAGLQRVLEERYVIDPHVFALPDNLGYAVTSSAGPRPQETWTALQGLVKEGRINRLEIDPCWEFLPNGRSSANACIPGEREFPDKAFRISGDFAATLTAPELEPIGDAWVLYNPLSPTPFFDPGERPGDESPPTFVRTGPDGSYRAPLNGLSGPIEIGVAKGCAEHTTVAIAEGPGTQVPTVLGMTTEPRKPGAGTGATTAATPDAPAGTPPAKPIASAPREKPGPEQNVCGPDVTDHVLGVLDMMRESYRNWGEAERSRRCGALYSLRSFNYAWDMQNFTPSDDTEPGKKPGEGGYLEHIFFQRLAPGYCAVPRDTCGRTVQFLGRCIHAQVVNYVQWGLMNQLCGTQARGILANLLRSGLSTNYPGQDGMSAIGHAFGSYGDMPLADKKAALHRYLDLYIADEKEGWNKMQGVNCSLTCGKYVPDMPKLLDGWSWGFAWGAGDDNIPITERGMNLKKP